jgi:CBS-domain-containing membrane protein
MAFLVAAGISNSESQRAHRNTDESKLATMPCGEWMTRRIVVASPSETLAHFHNRAVMEHSFDELPVVAKNGTFMGLAAMKSLRMIVREQWATTPVTAIMDNRARTVCSYHAMTIVEQELAHGAHDYIPVVDPATDRLIGILSAKDVLRARVHANELMQATRIYEFKPGLQTFANTKEG